MRFYEEGSVEAVTGISSLQVDYSVKTRNTKLYSSLVKRPKSVPGSQHLVKLLTGNSCIRLFGFPLSL